MGLSPGAAQRKLLSPRPRPAGHQFCNRQKLIPWLILTGFCTFVWIVAKTSPRSSRITSDGLGAPRGRAADSHTAATSGRVLKSEEEWKEILTSQEYNVIRMGGTEPRGTSPLLKEKRPGVFKCKACGQELFSSSSKYDSGTGWPSFFEALPGAVNETVEDKALVGMTRRTEVRCSRCGAHLGHVFNDGPSPTHRRYCMNGIALTFNPNASTGASAVV